ncbi:MAG: coenzyme F420-0:L-glutamate ligase [Patescibacteria group bacterium]
MEVTPFKIDIVRPPKDDLLAKIKASELTLEEGDVVALASKVVAIHQGRCVPYDRAGKDELIKSEADLWLDRDAVPGGFVMHTITDGIFMPSSGIDPFAGHYVLWPERLMETAAELLEWFRQEYGLQKLYFVMTDSRSVLMRRGVVGMAVAWAGFEPLFDNRVAQDLLGHDSGGSQTNLPDSIAAAAVLAMGEQNEQTPVVRIRNAPYVGRDQVGRKKAHNAFRMEIEEDIHAPFLRQPWQKGGRT